MIVTSFIVTRFSNLHIFVQLKIGYQPAKFECCDCLDEVLQSDWKNTDSVKLCIVYQAGKFQFSQLSGSSSK